MGAFTQCLWILTRGPIEEGNYASAKWLSDCQDRRRTLGFEGNEWRILR